jgi:hypothetical protein
LLAVASVMELAGRCQRSFGMHQPTVQHLPAIAHRGVDVSYETVRAWTMKFWPKIATNLRRRELPPSPR